MTFPQYNVATTVSPAGGKGLTIDILSADGLTYALNNPGFGYSTGDTVTVVPRDGAGTASTYSVTTTVVSTMKDVVSQYLPDSNVTTLTINAAGTGYTTTTVATTNTTISDKLLELGTGTTGAPSGDIGIILERGDSNNVCIVWDESDDKLRVATTTATGASTGDITYVGTTTILPFSLLLSTSS